MSEKDPLDPSNLELSVGDFAHKSIKGGLGAFPIVGSFLAEIFGLAKDSPYEKRKKIFMLALAKKLELLAKESKIDIEELKNNDEFLDIIIQTYEIAIKNSQKAKLDLLQNCVIHTALGIKITTDEKLLFLELLSKITPSHYLVLKKLYEPEEMISNIVNEKHQLGLKNKKIYEVRLPAVLNEYIKYDKSIYDVIISDLKSWYLFNVSHSIHNVDETPEIIIERMLSNMRQWQTEFGKRFLSFVESPEK
ncbi:MAG: hypothetical protein OER82_12700 [Nitrosopumilus sp.]|nr:hypothetical protein [Nitrosopumilus sp.]